MLSIPCTIAWYLFLVAAIWCFQRLTRCFTRINIFSLFTIALLLRHGISVPFDHNVNERFAGIMVSANALQRFYTSLILMYLFILLGIYVGKQVFGTVEVNEAAFGRMMRQKSVKEGINRPLFLIVLIIGVCLVMALHLRYDVSLREFLSGGLTSGEYRTLRDAYGEATHYSEGILLRLASITRFGLFPFFIYVLYFLKNRDLLWRGLFFFVLAVGLVIGILSGQKSPALFLVIGLVVAYYLKRGILRLSRLDWRIWGLLSAGMFIVVPFLYRIQYPDLNYVTIILLAMHRLTSEANRSLQLYFEIYPDIHPHLYGLSSSFVNSLLGLDIATDMLPERFIPVYYLGPEYLNTWNAAYVGVAWADFGYAGIIFESIGVGMLLQGYDRWFSRARKTALVMGTQVALMMAATKISEVSLSANLLTFGLLSSFLIFLVVKLYPDRSTKKPNALLVAYAHGSGRS